jgi:hypothetical protein
MAEFLLVHAGAAKYTLSAKGELTLTQINEG